MLVTGPSMAAATAAAFFSPLASRMIFFGLEDRAHAHRDGVDRHLLGLVEEAGVVLDGLPGQGLDAGPRAERTGRLVEGDVAVGADAQDLQVDAAALA